METYKRFAAICLLMALLTFKDAATIVDTYSATAGTGETLAYTVAAGNNTNTEFTAAMTGGKLVTAHQMAKETTVAYLLELNAVDDAAVPGTGVTYVAIMIRELGTAMETCGGNGANGVIGNLLVVMSLLMAKFLYEVQP